tara:strand:+ start:8257 stop:9747 length:1491 start_codon:yes stop_codon:yes gene_type:complete
MQSKSLFLILGNQLFSTKHIKNYKDSTFYMCEDLGLCTYQKHHKLKILLFLSSMRSYADRLKKEKYKIHYFDLNNSFDVPYEIKLKNFINQYKYKDLISFEIEDKFFEKKIYKLVKENNIKWKIIKNPMFLTSRIEFQDFISNSKKPLMANFYKIIRKKNNILMVNGKPKGNKWSYDKENRKKISIEIKIPELIKIKETKHTRNLKKIVQKNFASHPGDTKNFWFPTTHLDAEKWLSFFISKKLNLFGDYEDSLDLNNNILFHSVLSPLINIGLIEPQQILNKIIKLENKIKINSFEGFIRQIIGWREFMRGIYQNYDKELENNNFFKNKRLLKKNWYNGSTGLVPLDHSIKNAQKYGWTHHIERLMILANIMNLCEIKPSEAYNWFMEMFVDSSDWVMAPNLYGMGMFSDGGIFSTKPYICGSSYIMKMMNFKKGEWNSILDGLYWRFINKNRNYFLNNPRLSMMVKIFDKMDNKRKNIILYKANNFINENTYVN